MSGGAAIGRVRNAAPQNVGDAYPVPFDPTDGGVQAHLVGGVPIPVFPDPNKTIYSTAGAAEAFSIIPAAALPANVVNIIAHLVAAAAAPRWIQIHKGQGKPLAGAKPFLVGDKITPIGGNTQWAPPGGEERDPALSNGYVIITSTTQDTYTDTTVAELTTVATGRP